MNYYDKIYSLVEGSLGKNRIIRLNKAANKKYSKYIEPHVLSGKTNLNYKEIRGERDAYKYINHAVKQLHKHQNKNRKRNIKESSVGLKRSQRILGALNKNAHNKKGDKLKSLYAHIRQVRDKKFPNDFEKLKKNARLARD